MKEKYGQAARQAKSGARSCCGPAATVCCSVDSITKDLYNSDEMAQLPEEAVLASLGVEIRLLWLS